MLNPARVARIGVAIEYADGERVMMFSDSPTAEAELETIVERAEIGPPGMYRTMTAEATTTLTISGLRSYVITTGDDEATGQAIDGLQKSTGGTNHDRNYDHARRRRPQGRNDRRRALRLHAIRHRARDRPAHARNRHYGMAAANPHH
ncbi:hypothetical protein [Arthrobacter rhombi]|uniref:hypothetical protein n=1 Tax=Arthrobacter rhombi TaxID=71253 RepID=UPI003FCF8B52